MDKYEFLQDDPQVSDKQKMIILTKTVEQKSQFSISGLEQEISKCDEEIARQDNMKAELEKVMGDAKTALKIK